MGKNKHCYLQVQLALEVKRSKLKKKDVELGEPLPDDAKKQVRFD